MTEETDEKQETKSEEKTPRQQFAEWLESQEFYEHMQVYRHAGLAAQSVVVTAFERVKNLIRQKAKEIYEPEVHDDYITVYESIGGWKALHLVWSTDGQGFYEPEQTGVGAYATEAEAVIEAKAWAADEGLEFRERQPARN